MVSVPVSVPVAAAAGCPNTGAGCPNTGAGCPNTGAGAKGAGTGSGSPPLLLRNLR